MMKFYLYGGIVPRRWAVKISARLCFTILALASCRLLAAEDAGNLQPQEVLVIANRASADSLAVARHYMEKRAIPQSNLFILDFPQYKKTDALDDNPAWLSHGEFRDRMAGPLKRFLETNALRDKILCFVTTFDTPYRVGGFELTASELADPTATPPT